MLAPDFQLCQNSHPQGKAYGRLCAETISRIVKVQPKAEIVISACRFPSDTEAVYEAVREKGVAGAIRYWACHPYHQNPDASYAGFA